MAHFSLSWDAYKQNICSGLSALQQNGEFVDMTIAADGHHVKVHQMVLSLVSPYIKDLLASTQCPHPIIFLNKVSYPTLCSILEYIYTGQVLVAKENLSELVDAGKELHIKGLEDMKLEMPTQALISQALQTRYNGDKSCRQTKLDVSEQTDNTGTHLMVTRNKEETCETEETYETYNSQMNETIEDTYDTDTEWGDIDTSTVIKTTTPASPKVTDTRVQYTVSNQGSLQMILNRYIYYLRYTSRKGAAGHRQWRCVAYIRGKCPASVVTRDDVVVKRCGAHNHSFHDLRIMKKIRDAGVFSARRDAENAVHHKRQQTTPTTKNVSNYDDDIDTE